MEVELELVDILSFLPSPSDFSSELSASTSPSPLSTKPRACSACGGWTTRRALDVKTNSTALTLEPSHPLISLTLFRKVTAKLSLTVPELTTDMKWITLHCHLIHHDWAFLEKGTRSPNSCCSEALEWPSSSTTTTTQRLAVLGSSDVLMSNNGWMCVTKWAIELNTFSESFLAKRTFFLLSWAAPFSYFMFFHVQIFKSSDTFRYRKRENTDCILARNG